MQTRGGCGAIKVRVVASRSSFVVESKLFRLAIQASIRSLAPVPFDKLTAAGSAVTSLNYAPLLRISSSREEKCKAESERKKQKERVQ